MFKTQILHTFSKFIDGCTSHKAESVSYHKKSAAHVLETQCHKAKLQPEKMPKVSNVYVYILIFIIHGKGKGEIIV